MTTLTNSRSDMAMIRRAVKERWPITDDIRELVVNRMALVVGRGDKDRDRISAAAVLVAADRINLSIDEPEKEAPPTPSISVTVNQNATHGGTIAGARDIISAASDFARRLAGVGVQPRVLGDAGDADAVPAAAALGQAEHVAVGGVEA